VARLSSVVLLGHIAISSIPRAKAQAKALGFYEAGCQGSGR